MNYILSIVILLTGLNSFPVTNVSGENKELAFNLSDRNTIVLIDIDLEDEKLLLPIQVSIALLEFDDRILINAFPSYFLKFYSYFNSRAPPQFFN